MGDARSNAAEEVEQGVANRSHAVLDVVAENVQRPHVPDEMAPSAVEEHVRHQRNVGMWVAHHLCPLRVSKPSGYKTEIADENVQLVFRQRKLEKERERIEADEYPVGQGKLPRWDRVLQWNHHRSSVVAVRRYTPKAKAPIDHQSARAVSRGERI